MRAETQDCCQGKIVRQTGHRLVNFYTIQQYDNVEKVRYFKLMKSSSSHYLLVDLIFFCSMLSTFLLLLRRFEKEKKIVRVCDILWTVNIHIYNDFRLVKWIEKKILLKVIKNQFSAVSFLCSGFCKKRRRNVEWLKKRVVCDVLITIIKKWKPNCNLIWRMINYYYFDSTSWYNRHTNINHVLLSESRWLALIQFFEKPYLTAK